ncbi:MAG: tyrosine-type recombinase/integrase [Pseudobdellovibrionaceae bacterium]
MIKTYLKDGKKFYEVYVAERDITRKIISKRKRGIVSEREAKEIEFQFKAELRGVANQKPVWTWEKWYAEFLKRISRICKQSTISNYGGYLTRWIPKSWNEKALDQIVSDDIYEVLQNANQKLGGVSQKNILKMLRRIFQTALDDGLVSKNPVRGIIVRVPQVMQKVLTTKEVDLLLQTAKNTNHRFFEVWTLALQTGMRSGEMYALKWTDIDLDTCLISVNKQWTSKDGLHELKTGDWRVVPISSDLRILLTEMKVRKHDSENHVLPRLAEWTNGEQAKVLRDFCESIGITSVKFHDLRATFITNMLSQGVPLVKVMAIVGHKKMATKDIYL